jgi:hypothetical protein
MIKKHVHLMREIFSTLNIYKCLIICHADIFYSLHKQLVKNDYPISTLMELNKFNQHQNRILFLDNIDAKYMSTIASQINFEGINLVIYINVKKKIYGLEILHSIFL